MMKLATAALRLGVSQSTLRRWLKGGRVQGVRLGKQLFLSEDEVRRLETQGVDLSNNRGKEESDGIRG